MSTKTQRILKWAAVCCGVLSAVCFAWRGALELLRRALADGGLAGSSGAASIGIIGGADGPTAIFLVSNPGGIDGVLWTGVLLALLAGVLLLIRRKRR